MSSILWLSILAPCITLFGICLYFGWREDKRFESVDTASDHLALTKDRDILYFKERDRAWSEYVERPKPLRADPRKFKERDWVAMRTLCDAALERIREEEEEGQKDLEDLKWHFQEFGYKGLFVWEDKIRAKRKAKKHRIANF